VKVKVDVVAYKNLQYQ